MKHLYSLATAFVTLLASFTASAQYEGSQSVNLTINIDNAAAAAVYVNDDTPVSLVNGDNPMVVEDWSSVMIMPNEGYIVTSATHNGTAMQYVDGFYGTTISYEYFGANETITIKTADEASYYTGSCTLVVDVPEKVALSITETERPIAISEEESTLRFNPEKEKTLSISCANYLEKLYKVTVNGEEQPLYNGTSTVALAQDARIEVTTQFPEEPCEFKVTFVNEDCESFIKSFTVNNENVEPEVYLAEGYTVNMGQLVSIKHNSADYKINSITVNGEDLTSKYRTMFQTSVSGDIEIVYDVAKYQDITKAVNVTGAEHADFYSGYNVKEENRVNFVDGENEYVFYEKSNYFSIRPHDGYTLRVLTDNGEDMLPTWSKSSLKYIELKSEGTLTIEVVERVFDQQAVLYIDDKTAVAQLTVKGNDGTLFTTATGYNLINFDAACVPFTISWMGNSNDSNHLYVNNEEKEAYYGTTYNKLNLADGDVVKVYLTCDPSEFDVTITNEDNIDLTVTRDEIVAVADYTSPLAVLPGTSLKITAETEFNATVGDAEAVLTNELNYTAAEAVTIAIAKPETSGVENVAVTTDESAVVYNLQGIAVGTKATLSELPAGIYIVNGVKIAK